MPGLLAYRQGRAVGWVAVSPRSQLARLVHVHTLESSEAPDDGGAWSISCFYVHRADWRKGVATALLDAAIAWAIERGASSIEAYPVMEGNIDPYTGYDTMFEQAGFHQVLPGRGRGRALWRLVPGR